MSLTDSWRRARGRLRNHLVLAVVLASLPVVVLTAVVLTQRSEDTLEEEVADRLATRASAMAAGLDSFVGLRQDELAGVAAAAAAAPRPEAPAGAAPAEVAAAAAAGSAALEDVVDIVAGRLDGYRTLAVTDLDGDVLAGNGPGPDELAGEPWFEQATEGEGSVSPLTGAEDNRTLIVTEPVVVDAEVVAVAVGEVDGSALSTELTSSAADAGVGIDDGLSVTVVDGEGRAVSRTGEASFPPSGSSPATQVTEGVRAASAGGAGSATYEDAQGTEVVGGFAPVPTLGWAVVAEQPVSLAVGAANDDRALAVGLVVLAAAIAVAIALFTANRITRPLAAVASAVDRVADGDLGPRVEPSGPGEVARLSRSFNAMVDALASASSRLRTAGAELSLSARDLVAASGELAIGTAQQRVAADETSVTMGQLALASIGIAGSVERVARGTADTRRDLEHAGADIHATAERGVVLAERMGQVTRILELMDELAEQTNLLALNASIEAARAGDAGRSFTVVADEVRRLADRSRASSKEIAAIIEGVQTETNATVLALSRGALDVQRGLVALEALSEGSDRAGATLRRQQAATEQVVEAVESVSETSRQVSVTSSQIAAATADHAGLVLELEQAAAALDTTR